MVPGDCLSVQRVAGGGWGGYVTPAVLGCACLVFLCVRVRVPVDLGPAGH